MKTRLIISALLALLLASTIALGQADVLSSVPADAYGFAAAKSPQGVIDQIKQLLPFLAEANPDFEDPLAPLLQILGDVDFNGPIAVVLLKFDESDLNGQPPIVFLISAADPDAVLQAHLAKAGPSEEQLPDGIAKISAQDPIDEDLYLAVKGDFVVVAMSPKWAQVVLKSKASFEVLPEVRQAYEQGKIALLADLQRIKPLLISGLNKARFEARDRMEQISDSADSENTIEMDMGLLMPDLLQSFVEQLDKFIYILDINNTGVFYNQKIVFEADSPAAKLINAQMGQPDPSYKSVPSGAFLLAGSTRIDPEQLDTVVDTVLARAQLYPNLQNKLGEESTQKLIADIRAFYRQFSGLAFTAGMGSPATGMLNLVIRFDVADADAFKQQLKESCQSEFVSKLTNDTSVQFIYTDAAESYAGVNIDTIAIRLANSDQDNPPPNEVIQVMRVLPMVLGPDMSIRIAAPSDDQILLIVGGAFERAEQVINIVNGHGSSLTDYPKMTKALSTMPPNRIAEVHQDFGVILGMIKGFAPNLPPYLQQIDTADTPLISTSYSVEPNTLRSCGNPSISALLVAILVPSIQRARGQANAAVCATNMKGADTALYLYANSHQDKYPDAARWREVLIEEDYAPGKIFICPTLGGDSGKDNHYVFVPWPGTDEIDGNLLVIIERKANHYGHRNVVTGAHGVMNVSEAGFQEMLAKTIEALKAQGIDFNWQE